MHIMDEKADRSFKLIIRNFLIEMVIYSMLLVIYFFLALRYFSQPLTEFFDSSLIMYAIVGLGLIVAQAVVLDMVVTFLFNAIGLDRIE
jgi:mannitol-specific phosphotransferase system IIBC component